MNNKTINLITFLISSSICTIILFFFATNLFSRKRNEPPLNLDQKILIKAHNYKYSPEEINELRREFAIPYVFKDIQFEESIWNKKYVNKLSDGSRKTFGDDSCANIPKKRRIWVFGGSTLFGYGVSDNDTIPSKLSKILKEKSGNNWCVKNFGRGYYYSEQELGLFVKLLSSNYSKLPSKVIFIDGLNDHYHLKSSSYLLQGSLMYKKADKGESFSLKALNLLTRASNRIEQVFGGDNPKRFITKWQSTNYEECIPFIKINDFNSLSNQCINSIEKATNRMFLNWKTAKKISNSYGIKFIPILQPVPSFELHPESPFVNENEFGQHNLSGYAYRLMHDDNKKVKEKYQEINSDFINLSRIFSQSSSNQCKYPHIDTVHYSECGSELIANILSKLIF